MSDAHSPRPRTPARRTWLWAAGVVVCALALLAVHEFFLRSTDGRWLEQALLESRYASITVGPMQESTLFDVLSTVPLLVLALAGLIFVVTVLARRRFAAAGIALLTFLGANITTQLMKMLLVRHEPEGMPMSNTAMHEWWWAPEVTSFPSGHATLAAGAAVAVFLVVGPRQRPIVGLFTGLLAVVAGAAIFLTGHFASDIIAAYLVVAIWGLLGGWLVMRLGESWNTLTTEQHTPVGAGAGLAWFLGIILTGAALLALVFAGGWDAVTQAAEDPSGWHWVAGTLLPVGPGMLLCGAGISFFDAETGRRHPGEPLRETPQGYQVPPQFGHLYEA